MATQVRLVQSRDSDIWRKLLNRFPKVDVCQLPEYHDAYSTRFAGADALLWGYEARGEQLSYPFLLSPVLLQGPNGVEETGYYDVSGIYGYSGPLSTTDDPAFLREAWGEFDRWAGERRVICEFIRFSAYAGNPKWAHPSCQVEPNRPISLALLPASADEFFQQLPAKTRNMIRRATKEGLVARELDVKQGLAEFRELYRETMSRNQATGFFNYDDAYYNRLLRMRPDEVILFGVYDDDRMVSTAMALRHGKYALYHLGASDSAAAKVGAGNLAMFEMAKGLIGRGVGFFNIGGGRTTAADDPLFSFKRSNGTSVGEFVIGKRVIDPEGYGEIAGKWRKIHGAAPNAKQLQFYR